MSSDFVVESEGVGKCYQIYDRPIDRLKQSFWRGRKQFFRNFWAVKDISFTIAPGETVGIIGSNGAGKSTLLQLLCGILRPTVGQVRVKGRIAALLELGAGFNPDFTGRENIHLNAAVLGLSPSEIEKRYDEIVRFAGIGPFIEQPIKNYSSGMVVRLAFAVSVNVSPDILIVDEALAVGDIRFQNKCIAKIKEFCRSGTVIFVSHNNSAVNELCSRVLWIESGKIRMDGKPRPVIEKYLQFMYEENTESRPMNSESLPPMDDVSDLKGFSVIGNGIRQFGSLKAQVKAVRITTPEGSNSVLYGGEPCRIDIILEAHEDVRNPIVGFIVKDRLGRELFGENNLMLKKSMGTLAAGRRYLASFRVPSWPHINEDEYLVAFAVAEGSQEDHAQCHYLHDALVIRSVPIRPSAGVFSLVDTRFEVRKVN